MHFRLVDSDAGPLATTVCGTGSVLLVPVHGWTCRRSHWAGQLQDMAKFGEVLAVDLPGHGDSVGCPPPEASVAGLARTLTGVVGNAANSRRVVLIGHSMGGAVALEAARSLKNVAGVVLVDTFVIPYGDLTEAQAVAIEDGFRENFVAAMTNLVETNTRPDLFAPLRAQLLHDMASADPRWALPLWSNLLRWQPDASLASSSGRIHAINGGMVPDAARQRCAPHLRETVIGEARHFPQFDTPEHFSRQLQAALAALLG